MSEETKVFDIGPEDLSEHKRLDAYLSSKLPDISRSLIKKLYNDGHIQCEGLKLELKKMPPLGSKILFKMPAANPTGISAQDLPLEILFEDEHLLECDLIYSHADGRGFLDMSKEHFEKYLPEDWWIRLFRFVTSAKPNSPGGFLPTYRYQFMDPNSLGALLYDQPAWDGSSCKVMAQALRKIVKARFQSAGNVSRHNLLQDSKESI